MESIFFIARPPSNGNRGMMLNRQWTSPQTAVLGSHLDNKSREAEPIGPANADKSC